MADYAIGWGSGRQTRVGADRKYAEQLLKEASGPFSAFDPMPTVIEVGTCEGDEHGLVTC